jgi:hypothetical protein
VLVHLHRARAPAFRPALPVLPTQSGRLSAGAYFWDHTGHTPADMQWLMGVTSLPSPIVPGQLALREWLDRRRSPGPGGEDGPLPAAVTIFETHDVIELSGAGLKDDRVLQGCHAMPGAGAEMDCLAGEQLE